MSETAYYNVILTAFNPTVINNQVMFSMKVKHEDISSTSNKLQFLEKLGITDITAPFTGADTCWSNITYKLYGEYSLKFKISISGMEYLEDCVIDTIAVKRAYDNKSQTFKYTYNFSFICKDVPKDVFEKYCNVIKYKEIDPETDKETYKPLDMEITSVEYEETEENIN